MKSWLRKFWAHVGGYLALAALLTVLMAVFANERRIETISVRFVINLLISLSIGGAIDAARLIIERQKLGKAPLKVAYALSTIAAVVLGTELARLVSGALFPEHAAWFPRSGVILVAIPVTIVMLAIGLGRNRLEARAEALEQNAAEAREQLLKAQLETLKARTNPHFLFNALNVVASLIGEDPPKAEAAVLRLASLLRYALEGSKKDKVRLAEEMEQIESYLEFERLRFGDRLMTSVELPDDARDTLLPPLLLQPLVENAIHHGVAARSGGGHVFVKARRTSSGVAISVEDDGPGPGASTHVGTRTSQADLRERLRLAYGDRARFATSRGEMGGFRVDLELPE